MARNRYFDDVTIGEEITLDIDLFVEDWLLLARPGFMAKLHDIEERFHIPVRAWYRESSHRNVHIKMKFPYPVSMLEALLFRAWFDDDKTLLFIDMKRYFKTMDAENKFMRRFDCKGKINDAGEFEIFHAGEWIQLC
jgi:hypothetical protein